MSDRSDRSDRGDRSDLPEPALLQVWGGAEPRAGWSPSAPAEAARGWLAEWYAGEAAAEAWIGLDRERLERAVRTARLLWAWYGIAEVARLQERAMHLAETLKDSGGIYIYWRSTIRDALWEGPIVQMAWDPRCVHVLAWDRAEIAEQAGQDREAIRWYLRFLKEEQHLDPVEIPAADQADWRLRRPIPTTPGALRRIGGCHLRLGEGAAALEAQAAALSFVWSAGSPFGEMAEAAGGRGGEAALGWEERRLRTLGGLRAERRDPARLRALIAGWRALGQAWREIGQPEGGLRCAEEEAILSLSARRLRAEAGAIRTTPLIGPEETKMLSAEADLLAAEAGRM